MSDLFAWGWSFSTLLVASCYKTMQVPVSTKPYRYFTIPIFGAVIASYMDWSRRLLLEDIMKYEDRQMTQRQTVVLDRMRLGEELEELKVLEDFAVQRYRI
eukprot:CAMPEP_0114576538 /NCGR_PEP_ID=MMETSP0125-20121206/1286_1 /TAXON_ID=485358 ORGANISM="Aristerostoma sp., Strain ATCC 50986" /NCGR_SAMPLE_ID=MMETSP0125 /ASSEMBLY_ACC=CAM_ASM_000245 /LENGTH=100 /DNA_ID=CAMNT_0001765125 /DNA_START=54 /DNA_END=356 /DNA_ORIENTATION=+